MPRASAEQPQHDPILRTKLYRPPVTGDAVHRSRLHGQMDFGLETPLTLVAAPAGYGKSTLVSHWIESLDHPAAWLSLDVADGDLTVFTSYLIAAIRTLFPDACGETEALIAAPKLPPLSVLGGCLVNELDEIDTPFVLTLDDYHRIAPMSDVHELIGFILNHPPASLRLVIVTRRDPPLTIASMRASRRLTDVRAKDLKFSISDITAFLEITAGLSIGEEALANLQQQTEGWAVGLQLVALHLRHIDDPDGFLKELGGGIHHITRIPCAGGPRRTITSDAGLVVADLHPRQLLRPAVRRAACRRRLRRWLRLRRKAASSMSCSETISSPSPSTINRSGSGIITSSGSSSTTSCSENGILNEVAALHARASAWFSRSGADR